MEVVAWTRFFRGRWERSIRMAGIGSSNPVTIKDKNLWSAVWMWSLWTQTSITHDYACLRRLVIERSFPRAVRLQRYRKLLPFCYHPVTGQFLWWRLVFIRWRWSCLPFFLPDCSPSAETAFLSSLVQNELPWQRQLFPANDYTHRRRAAIGKPPARHQSFRRQTHTRLMAWAARRGPPTRLWPLGPLQRLHQLRVQHSGQELPQLHHLRG